MCGRFALNSTPRRIARHFDLREEPALFAPRYNIAPTQPVAIVRENEHLARKHGGKAPREFTHVRWGLIPSWAKDPAIGNRMINARSETAATKPGYRGAFKYRRCLIPADGFYEWKKSAGKSAGGGKQPYYIRREDGEPFAFAGLWEHWQSEGGEEMESCTILTTDANDLLKPIHDRMPVILSPSDYALWLDTSQQEREAVTHLLRPPPTAGWEAVPVSTYVNSPKNEGEQCVAEVGTQGGLFE